MPGKPRHRARKKSAYGRHAERREATQWEHLLDLGMQNRGEQSPTEPEVRASVTAG